MDIQSTIQSFKMNGGCEEEYLEEVFFVRENQFEPQVESNIKVNKKYSEENLLSAIRKVSEGSSKYAAAKEYGVPVSTLNGRLKGVPPIRAGPQPLLSLETERKLANWIIECAEMGDPKTKDEVLTASTELCKVENKPTKNDLLSRGWLKGFLKRNPKVTFRTPQAVTRASASVSEDDIRRFFTHFYDWVKKENLLHCLTDPSRFINSDETGFDLNPSPRHVLAAKGSKNVYRVDAAKPKQRVSVMYTFGANGTSYTPQLIFRKSFSKISDVLRSLGGKNILWLLVLNFIHLRLTI